MAETTRQAQNDIGTRIQALTLLENKFPIAQITEITGVSKSQVYSYRRTAIQRGYNPQVDKRLLISYVEDAPRSGRPVKATEEVKKQLVEVVTKNSTTRQWSTQKIANAIALIGTKISARTVLNILNSLGYSPCKPTYKPGLTIEAKATRLKWCLDHKD